MLRKILSIVLCNQKLSHSNSLKTEYFLLFLARINYMFYAGFFI